MAKSIPAKEFKAAVKSLNEILAEAGEDKIKVVGVKKEAVVEEFTNSVLNYIDNDDAESLPDDVIDIYNEYIAADEEEEAEEKPAPKKKPAGKKAPAKKTAGKTTGKKAPAKKAAPKKKKPAGPKVGAEIIKAIVENDNTLDRKVILDEVAKVFPDRPKDGMKTTVNHVVGVMTNYFNYVNSKK